MSDEQIFDVGQQVAELRGIVVEGFRGVHARQDITNGRIGKVEVRVQTIEEKHKTEDGIVKGVRLGWGFIFSVIILVSAVFGILLYFK